MIQAIFVPHAGIQYSGAAAAAAYDKIDFEKYNEVIMFSTNHYYNSNKLVTTNKYKHPEINQDIETIDFNTFNKEHSWQNQMEFIHHNNIYIFLVGKLPNYTYVANYLKSFINPKVLLIFNSDLSHENPNNKKTGYTIKAKEQSYINSIINLTKVPNKQNTICGLSVIKLMVSLLKNLYVFGKKMSYYQSSNINENIKPPKLVNVIKEYNVSYLSVVYFNYSLREITSIYRKYERIIVQYTHSFLSGKKTVLKIPEKLNNRKVYCFVTIRDKTKTKKELVLGCMRNSTFQPLDIAIREAINSIKQNDSRYNPNIPFSQMSVSVTILGTPTRIKDKNDIKLGKHGITLIRENEDLGTYYLSDVPINQGWTIDETLRSLKGKGGINDNLFDIYKVPELNLTKNNLRNNSRKTIKK